MIGHIVHDKAILRNTYRIFIVIEGLTEELLLDKNKSSSQSD